MTSIPVTKPFMPPFEEYTSLLAKVWEREWLTNAGPLARELEAKLTAHLQVPNCLFVSNGTIALQLAIQALKLKGEVITTPFSYVATTSSLVWEGLVPVMADIDRDSLNIDPVQIEKAITAQTTGILATHVFGNPCDVEAIQAIADKHNLKVIYDAAHAFGVTYGGKSLFDYGDIATTSFHATKLFHTGEGGAVFSPHSDIVHTLTRMRNFGHKSPVEFDEIGINAKNSELHAALGLVNLTYIDKILARRAEICQYYDVTLGDKVGRQKIAHGASYNHAYYPIIVKDEATLLKLMANLEAQEINPRRYFYPSLSDLPYLTSRTQTPIANDIAKRIVCLPLYHNLRREEQDRVCEIVSKTVGQ